MSTLKIVKADSRGGRKAIARLADRATEVMSGKLRAQVEGILDGVRRKGDAALLKAVRRYDGHRAASVAELRYDAAAGAPLPSELPGGFAEALERAIAAVERYHAPQVHEGYVLDDHGLRLEERRTPLRRVGIYVPGGRAAYPSTLVMSAVPARLAGVGQIVVATPPKAVEGNAPLRYALQRLGVDEIWRMGGAHAVAALAYGTETVERVDKIVGPGNAWVTEAKRRVNGEVVGIDSLAGPSEVVVFAAGDADPETIAIDLLAQAEHDPLAAAILVTPDKKLARAVDKAVAAGLATLPPETAARASIAEFGIALLVEDAAAGAELVDRIAPEHLQLVGAEAEAFADRPFAAGAIFVGAETPEAFGDYVAGPNHVLPTGGTARFASALGVEDFVRRSHVIRCDATAASHLAEAAAALADAEGLPAHAASARRRLRRSGEEG